MAIVIAIFVLFTCNGKKPEKPVFIQPAKIVERIKVDSIAIKKVIDSFNVKIKKVEDRAVKSEKSTLYYQSENRRISALLKSRDTLYIPSGDNEYYSQQEAVAELIRSSELADSSCNVTIAGLKDKSMLQDSIILSQQVLIDKKSGIIYELQFENSKAFKYIGKLEKSNKWSKVGKFSWKGIAIGLAGILLIKSIN